MRLGEPARTGPTQTWSPDGDRSGRTTLDLVRIVGGAGGSDAGEKHDSTEHAQRLVEAVAAVRRLNAKPTSARLVEEACADLVRWCDFERAVLSGVDDMTCCPLASRLADGRSEPAWPEGRADGPTALDETLAETRVVRECRPILVDDTAGAGAHRAMFLGTGRSTSYVVAPVVVRGEVVGLLHADHGPGGRRCDDIDRDVLWAFAQGLGLVYERRALAEEYGAQRMRLQDALASTHRMLSSSTEDLGQVGDDEAGALPALHPVGALEEVVGHQAVEARAGAADGLTEEPLTNREREVLELMALGASNPTIASELVVSASTVKSHVRHILRKLGAVNRAQAIARYLGSSG